jgi:hypothetical protein
MRDEAYDHVDPYADGTYGTNYTPASTELERDKHAELSHQQDVVLGLATNARYFGITGWDVKEATDWETNAVSRSLSNLLRDGRLVRLKARRGRAHIHVVPEWVAEREVLPYMSTNTKNRRAALMEARNAVAAVPSVWEALAAIDNLIAREES